MRARCSNPGLQFAHRYVLRGIRVCREWENYETFRSWALSNGYNDKLSIDRINPDGNYEPLNCRWADSITQNNNTSRNVFITVAGKLMTVADARRMTGRHGSTYYRRLRKGWTPERALMEPSHKGKQR